MRDFNKEFQQAIKYRTQILTLIENTKDSEGNLVIDLLEDQTVLKNLKIAKQLIELAQEGDVLKNLHFRQTELSSGIIEVMTKKTNSVIQAHILETILCSLKPNLSITDYDVKKCAYNLAYAATANVDTYPKRDYDRGNMVFQGIQNQQLELVPDLND